MTQKFDTEVARKGGPAGGGGGAAGGLGAEYRQLSRDRNQAAAAKSRTIQVITGASMASMRQPVSIGTKRKVRRWVCSGCHRRGSRAQRGRSGCTPIGVCDAGPAAGRPAGALREAHRSGARPAHGHALHHV